MPKNSMNEFPSRNGPEEKKLYKANPDFILRSVAGENIAVPTGATAHDLNAAMILTEGGSLLWERLSKNSCTKTDLANALEEQYDVEHETAIQDVSSFLKKAIDEGVVYQV